ncbi:MAG TPA: endonuclease III [Terriglobia bacterium]|nr:endonuclease III [Terriglobia bacterium]
MAFRSLQSRKKRTQDIIKILKKTYPNTRLALNYSNPLELLIALILAARCTDERVNQVTAKLFKKYRTAKDWASVDRAVLEQEIRSTGFFRQKAAAIQNCAQVLVEKFGGRVPDKLEDLLTLPGVGRKTANILLGNAFGKPAIGVDTHVARVSYRLGLTKNTDPDKIETDLAQLIPDKDKVQYCLLIQRHGREICVARKPKCEICPLNPLCPKQGVKKSSRERK